MLPDSSFMFNLAFLSSNSIPTLLASSFISLFYFISLAYLIPCNLFLAFTQKKICESCSPATLHRIFFVESRIEIILNLSTILVFWCINDSPGIAADLKLTPIFCIANVKTVKILRLESLCIFKISVGHSTFIVKATLKA